MTTEAEKAANRERTFVGGRGVNLHEMRWVPENGQKPRFLLFLVHGYAHNIAGIAEHLNPAELAADKGIGIFGISHHGHGYSEGMKALVMDFNHLVDDYADYVLSVKKEYPDSPAFLVSQSMGGAIALLATCKGGPLEDAVAGSVLMAPMCKIADEMMPPPWVLTMFTWMAYVIPSWSITPVDSPLERCFKDPKKYEEALADPLGYHARPRARTGLEMLKMTQAVEACIPEYRNPFIVLHGDADTVTSPEASKYLFDNALSEDKALKMMEGMWHAMLSEPDPGPQLVIDEFLSWIEARI